MILPQRTANRGPRVSPAPAFTLVELLVVIAVIAVLIGIILPTLGAARRSAQALASASQLKQLGAGIAMYRSDFDLSLPQLRVDPAGNPVQGSEGDNIGSLFGGKLGTLPFFGINEIGPERRPLNPYVWDDPLPEDDTDAAESFELPLFSDPTDAGTNDPLLASFGIDTSNTYDLLGSSYTLNDHALDKDPGDEPYPTLIPERGGRMPRVLTPTKTWLLATQPIYNYDDGSDRGMRWSGRPGESGASGGGAGGGGGVVANLLYVDLHADAGLPVPPGDVQTTGDYTFLPQPDWLEQFDASTP